MKRLGYKLATITSLPSFIADWVRCYWHIISLWILSVFLKAKQELGLDFAFGNVLEMHDDVSTGNIVVRLLFELFISKLMMMTLTTTKGPVITSATRIDYGELTCQRERIALADCIVISSLVPPIPHKTHLTLHLFWFDRSCFCFHVGFRLFRSSIFLI